MSRRERLIEYIKENFDDEFDPQDQLVDVMDSVSMLQMIQFIDQELEVPLDLSDLSMEMFATVDTVVAMLAEVQAE